MVYCSFIYYLHILYEINVEHTEQLYLCFNETYTQLHLAGISCSFF